MKSLKAKFYKYHRQLGIIFSFPLALCAISAMGMTISHEFLHNKRLSRFFYEIHTMAIFRSELIEIIYSFIVGLSLLGLIITGLIIIKPTKKK